MQNMRAVHVLVIDSNFPRQYALETLTHNNPFTLAKSLKGKGGMYMLLQRRNCTHSTSTSCLWGGVSMKQINPSMLIYRLAKTCMYTDNTFLPHPQTCWTCALHVGYNKIV